MNAAEPAAGAALAFLELGDGAGDVVLAGGLLLDLNVPADPFVTGQRREAFPGGSGARGSLEGLAQVVGKLVDGAL